MPRISIKIARQRLATAFAIALGFTNFLSYPTLAQIRITTLFSQYPSGQPNGTIPNGTVPAGGQNHAPPPPNLPRSPAGGDGLGEPPRVRPQPPHTPPPNQRIPGGGLGNDSSCESTSKPVTALIPVENPVITTKEHPTFLFYVPYASDKVRYGEFSLLIGPDEKTRLGKTIRFTLPQTPGIVSVTLPSTPEYALEEGQYYHWYFKLYCQTNTSSQPGIDVNGWVQRVALTPERKRQINAATPDVWYDASANLAERLRTSPQDAALRNDWVNLLESINSEDLAQEPLVGPVIPLED